MSKDTLVEREGNQMTADVVDHQENPKNKMYMPATEAAIDAMAYIYLSCIARMCSIESEAASLISFFEALHKEIEDNDLSTLKSFCRHFKRELIEGAYFDREPYADYLADVMIEKADDFCMHHVIRDSLVDVVNDVLDNPTEAFGLRHSKDHMEWIYSKDNPAQEGSMLIKLQLIEKVIRELHDAKDDKLEQYRVQERIRLEPEHGFLKITSETDKDTMTKTDEYRMRLCHDTWMVGTMKDRKPVTLDVEVFNGEAYEKIDLQKYNIKEELILEYVEIFTTSLLVNLT